jgi:glycosyltransferase involved in cell wall biosynthesis
VKVLNVIGSVDRKGGGTTDHVFSSSKVWSRHGHECHILCLDSPTAACVARSPVRTYALGSQGPLFNVMRWIIPLLRYGYTPKLARWLRMNAQSYDAIILNGLWNYTSYGSWSALKKLDVPYYVCPHGMLDPWLKKAHPAGHFLRTVFWNLFERKVLRDTRGIFFACEEERKLANQSFLRDNPGGYVVGYGTQDIAGDENTRKAAFFSKVPRARGRKLILFLSRLHPKKGLDLLIQALARHALEVVEFDLVIAGPDDVGLKPQLTKIAAELGVADRIHWTGMLTGDEKWGAFHLAEFFVLPSHQENFGIAVVEAMALAVPVLITNKVNIWRQVQSSGAGCVVTDDADGIAQGLQDMCRMPPSQRQTLAANARTCFLEQFDLEKNAMELLNLMMRLGRPSACPSRQGKD